jgi:hypothetical protein
MQDVIVARLQGTGEQIPFSLSIKCNDLRENLSEYSQNIPCATLKRRWPWVISIHLWYKDSQQSEKSLCLDWLGKSARQRGWDWRVPTRRVSCCTSWRNATALARSCPASGPNWTAATRPPSTPPPTPSTPAACPRVSSSSSRTITCSSWSTPAPR